MGDVSEFDWIRWVDIPVFLALLGVLIQHMRHQHNVEVEYGERLAKLEGLGENLKRIEDQLDILLEKMLERQDGRSER